MKAKTRTADLHKTTQEINLKDFEGVLEDAVDLDSLDCNFGQTGVVEAELQGDTADKPSVVAG